MQLRTAAVLAVAGALAAPPAAGARHELLYRIAGESWNLGESPDCPDGSVRYDIDSRAGIRIGMSTVCVLDSRKTDRAGYGVARIVQRVVETDRFRTGWLRSRLTYDFRYARDAKRAAVTVAGTVVGGTGRYAHASGIVSGRGSMTIDDAGEHPRIAVTVRLR